MLPRQNRLKGQANFQKIYKQGRKIWSPYFLLIYNLNPTLNQPLIGIVASKKVGGAVQRNKAKRMLRDAIGPIIPNLPKSMEMVVIASHNTLNINMDDLSKQMLICLQNTFQKN